MGKKSQVTGECALQNMKDGDVLFFDKNTTFGVAGHLHICVVKGSGQEPLIFACCTSQQNTMERLIEKQNLDSATIVHMSKNSYSFLTTSTFINCNSLFEVSKSDFINDWDNQHLEVRQNLGISHYSQIVDGVLKSNLVPEEIKDRMLEISLDDY